MARRPNSKKGPSSKSSSKSRTKGSRKFGSKKKATPSIAVLTLFPDFIASGLQFSLIGKALQKGILAIEILDIRDFAPPPHYEVDDKPYGGGAGMLLRADVLYKSWKKAIGRLPRERVRTVLLSPQGVLWKQPSSRTHAAHLQEGRKLILVCGHYEGVDERFIEECVDEEVSIGDYVLTGGELPALAVIDSIARSIPGVVQRAESVETDSLAGGLLKYPQYTRPAHFRGRNVPEVLLSGNHAAIARWRENARRERTAMKRPDLLSEEPKAENRS